MVLSPDPGVQDCSWFARQRSLRQVRMGNLPNFGRKSTVPAHLMRKIIRNPMPSVSIPVIRDYSTLMRVSNTLYSIVISPALPKSNFVSMLPISAT